MTTYIVGDIQGCYRSLRGVLDQVQFDVARDRLWSVGDIVNRGPQSLETLRFLKQLGSAFQMVLGNHDLHLLAVAYGYKDAKRGDTLDTILNAPDRIDLLEWLRHQPLILDQQTDLVVHAGIPAIWPRDKALALAQEVTRVLRSDLCHEFFRNMYGNEPAIWRDALQGMERLRVITNYFTRMRICKDDGTLDLHFKKSRAEIPEGFQPWFEFHSHDSLQGATVHFGHWAALESQCYHTRFNALDSGCVWGKQLTLYAKESRARFHYNCGCETS